MTSNRWQATWLFRLLDYEHYAVGFGGISQAHIVINHTDRSVWSQLYDTGSQSLLDELPTSYSAMRQWLRSHEK